jgi:adenosylmethionine-8-amino-7-oxononanoate aminotransferase
MDALERMVPQRAGNVCEIVHPLRRYMAKAKEICKKYNVLLIADEVQVCRRLSSYRQD